MLLFVLLFDGAVVAGMMGALPRPPQSEHFPMPPVGMMQAPPVSMATAGLAPPEEAKKTSSFDRIVEKLSPIYPNHTRQAAATCC